MKRLYAWAALTIALVCLAGQQAVAQNFKGASSAEKEQIEAALKLTTEAAGKYEIAVAGASKGATLVREPVLRWSNPAVGEIHGNVFLWTAAGRPVAVGSLFKWFSPHTHTSHEFQSLSEQKLIAKYDGREVWKTTTAGVRFAPLADDAPAATAARRLVQLRQLAKRFTGRLTTREGEPHELRLLTQPIYRYESAQGTGDENTLDGGLFAFVQGTDPDILLTIEALGGEKPQWRFAAARLQNCALAIELDGREVWSAPQLEWSVAFNHGEPYTLFDTPGQ